MNKEEGIAYLHHYCIIVLIYLNSIGQNSRKPLIDKASKFILNFGG